MKKLMVIFCGMMTTTFSLVAGLGEHEYSYHVNGDSWYYRRITDNTVEIVYANGEHVVAIIPATLPVSLGSWPVTSISSSAFSDWSQLAEVTIPSSVRTIASHAFYGCNGLTSVTIPGSVKSFGGAFSGCQGLARVTILDGVTYIDSAAFYNCVNLREMFIPERFKQTFRPSGSYGYSTDMKVYYYNEFTRVINESLGRGGKRFRTCCDECMSCGVHLEVFVRADAQGQDVGLFGFLH